MSTINAIQTILDQTMVKIGEAATKHDVKGLASLTERATELERMKKTVEGIETALKQFSGPQGASGGPAGLRRLPIEVTQGMINQNLLTLTDSVKAGRIKSGEELLIEARPTGDRFRTELLEVGHKLRERGAVGKFYRDAGVRAGDFVVLAETAAGQWLLEKAQPGEFKSYGSVFSW